MDDIIKQYPSLEPEVLVLGPGGIKGFQILGCLISVFPLLKKLKTIIGCSVGSIIGMMLCLGYAPKDIFNEIINFDLFEGAAFSLNDLNNGGLIKHAKIEKELKKIIQKILPADVTTLEDLYQTSNLELITTTLNKTTDEVEYISYKNHPKMNVIRAVMLSINVPLLFEKMVYRGCVYIDGAFGNPFPIDILDDGKTDILGIMIETDPKVRNSSDDIIPYIYGVLNATIIQLKKRIIKTASEKCRIIGLTCHVLDMSGLSVSHDDKIEMIKRGFAQGEEFMKSLMNKEQGIEEPDLDEIEIVDKKKVEEEGNYLYVDKDKKNEDIFDEIVKLKTS